MAEKLSKNSKVFVGNLPFRTSWQDLKDLMREVGNVVYSKIFQDNTGRSKGCGIVEFSTENAALDAISKFDKIEYQGRVLTDNQNTKPFDQTKSIKPHFRQERKEIFGGNQQHTQHNQIQQNSHQSYKNGINNGGDTYNRNENQFHNEQNKNSTNYKHQGGHNKYNREDTGDENTAVIVHNLPSVITWQNLKDAFKEFGFVSRSDIPTDGQFKGKGIVKFSKKENALKAIQEMNKAVFNGHEIQVELMNATEPSKN